MDGTVSTPVVTKYNQAIDGTKVPTTVKDGYTFKEWNTQEDGQGTAFDVTSLITADQTVYAIYEANDVTVTFVDGTVSTPVVTKYNQAIDGTKVPTTVKDGYTFKEWNTQEDGQGTAFDVTSLITADQTVYAIYEANDVTVTFVDGTVSTPVVTKYNQAIDGTKIPTTVKDGYTFKEWNTQADGKGLMIDLTQPINVDQTVYAIYEKNIAPVETVTVTFVDGETTTPVVVAINTVIPGDKVPTPVKEGYTFKGWNTQADGKGLMIDLTQPINVDQTVYAIYEKNIVPVETVTVTFVDGETTIPVVVAINTVIPGDKVPTPVKEGYTFKGWNTQADGKGQYFDVSIAVAEDITLYAVYEMKGTKPVLPETGVASNSYILIGGVALVVSGLYLSTKKRKQQKYSEN